MPRIFRNVIGSFRNPIKNATLKANDIFTATEVTPIPFSTELIPIAIKTLINMNPQARSHGTRPLLNSPETEGKDPCINDPQKNAVK